MIKIFVENTELDLFDDESITLNRSIKNLTDISTVYTTFSQGFTVPASRTNNRIFEHWYRDDLLTGFTGLQRLDAFITLNGQLIERGGIKLEGATIENGIPKDYKLGFYGNVSKLKELVGTDTLQKLDLSAYDHAYDGATILDGFGSDTTGSFVGLSSGNVIYPPFSPVRNWVYDSGTSSTTNNIAWVDDGTVNGVYYYEPKPAIKVTKLLEAIESEYDVTFNGSFLSSTPFTNLFLWLHNREGYNYEGQDETQFDAINARKVVNVNHTNGAGGIAGVGSNLTYIEPDLITPTVAGLIYYEFAYEFTTLSSPCFLILKYNGVVIDYVKCTSTGVSYKLGGQNISQRLSTTGGVYSVEIVKLTTSLTYQLSGTVTTFVRRGRSSGSSVINSAMASSSSLTGAVVMSNLLPDISITEFINGLIKLYNLVVTSDDGITYTFETYDSYYGSGQEIDISRWLDTKQIEVESVPKYGALSFEYEESDQVLHKQFRAGNGRNYGDLIQRLNFDASNEFAVKVPFESLFTEKLTDLNTGTSFTDFTVYKSIEVDQDGSGSAYLGAPILFYYAENLDISSTAISFVDESDVETEVVEIPFCELVSDITASSAEGLTFGEEVNPYLEDRPNESLYSAYWSNWISQVYDTRTRVYKVKAYLNLGTYVTLDLNDTVLWKGRKYLINNISTNFQTGETDIELVTKV